jgi:predicted RND superfamily exporter protein
MESSASGQPSGAPAPGHDAPAAFFAAWARFVLRFRWPLLALTLLCDAGMLWAVATRLRVDTGPEAFMSTEPTAARLLESLRDDFGRDEYYILLVEGDVFSMPFLERLRALHTELAAFDMELPSLGKREYVPGYVPPATAVNAAKTKDDDFGDFGDDAGWGDEKGGAVIDEIVSLVNVRKTTWDDGLVVGELLSPWPAAAALPALKQKVLAEPTLVGRVVDADARHAAILVRMAFMSQDDQVLVYNRLLEIAAAHDKPGFTPVVAGLPAFGSALNELLLGDVFRMGLLSLFTMLLLTAVLFRHPVGVAGPVLVVMQSILWTFGAMALSDEPMTMVSNVLPGFIICCAIAEALHVQSVYREALLEGMPSHDAIVHAIAATGVPIFYTSATTWIGFLSFWFTDVHAIRDLGTFGAFGVAVALLHTLVFLPILLSLPHGSLLGARKQTHADGGKLDRALLFFSNLSRAPRGRRWVLVGTGVLMLLSIWGMTQLRVYHNGMEWVPPDEPIRVAFKVVDDALGSSTDMTLLIDTHEGKTLHDAELMHALEELEAHILTYRHPVKGKVVTGVTSVLDVLRESNRALHQMEPRAYALPRTQQEITDLFTLFESNSPEHMRRLATVDLTRGIMVVRLKWLDAGSYGPVRDHVERGIATYVGDRAEVHTTGSALSLLLVVDSLVTSQVRSVGSALLVIAVMMVWLLRNLRLGLTAMIPNFLPIMGVMAVMAWLDIPIDLANVLVGAIASGIAVDDTIHFMHQFRAHYLQHGDTEAAIDHAFAHAGKPMALTMIVLLCGFGVFVAAKMYSLQRFGLLMAITLIAASFYEVILSPALLRVLYPQRVTAVVPGAEAQPAALSVAGE